LTHRYELEHGSREIATLYFRRIEIDQVPKGRFGE
jgi:hypothetical protein